MILKSVNRLIFRRPLIKPSFLFCSTTEIPRKTIYGLLGLDNEIKDAPSFETDPDINKEDYSQMLALSKEFR